MLHLSKMDVRSICMSKLKIEFSLSKFAGLNLVFVLPVEFKICEFPMAVLLDDPKNESLPIHRLNMDCPVKGERHVSMSSNL